MPDRYTAEELDALSRGIRINLGVDHDTAEDTAADIDRRMNTKERNHA